jgi:outer membrane protein TolC
VRAPEYCAGDRRTRSRPGRWQAGALSLALAGCIQVGPDYTPPEAPLAPEWQGSDDQRIETSAPEDATWWRTLNDPALSALIEMAPAQNPTVQIAGVRVLQARAQLGAAIGELYPQQQQATGEVRYEKLSDRDSSSALLQEVQEDVGNSGDLPSLEDRSFWITEFGIGAAWELDLWGKFRRSLESALGRELRRCAREPHR